MRRDRGRNEAHIADGTQIRSHPPATARISGML